MIGALIAAGGRGSRMGGRQKALIAVDGVPAIDRLVAVMRAAKLDPIVVVASGETLAHARASSITAVESDPEQPMIDSLARGALAFPPSVQAAIVQPVDAPFTDGAMIAALLAGGNDRPRVLCHRGVPGHPVLLPARLFPLLAQRPEGGLRAILADLEVELVEWPDARVLADLDSPADLAAWGV